LLLLLQVLDPGGRQAIGVVAITGQSRYNVLLLLLLQVLDPGGRRVSPQLALFEELVVRAYLAVSKCCAFLLCGCHKYL
jgi:hypothetical protein